MAKVELGGLTVPMFGFDRQKKVASPTKKAKRWAIRRYVVPSVTKESLPARICLAEAAQSAYGKSFENVIANVKESCSGKDYGGARKAKSLRTARHSAATANIAKMKTQLAGL